MKRVRPEVLVRGLFAMTCYDFTRGSIFACRYLPTGEKNLSLCPLCLSGEILESLVEWELEESSLGFEIEHEHLCGDEKEG